MILLKLSKFYKANRFCKGVQGVKCEQSPSVCAVKRMEHLLDLLDLS